MTVYIGGINIFNRDRFCPASRGSLKVMAKHYLIVWDFKMPMDEVYAEFVVDIVA